MPVPNPARASSSSGKRLQSALLSRFASTARSKAFVQRCAVNPALLPACQIQARRLHQSVARRTFEPAWTEARVKMPWIEALNKRREEEKRAAEAAKSGVKVDGEAEVEADAGVVDNVAPKKMGDSYYRTILPLGQDPWLLDTYLNASGHIRMGSLLMDLDALAGVVGYRHTGDGPTMVTAAVDRITIERPLKEICDLELSGQVTYATGRSSMEVSLQVAKAPTLPDAVAKPEDVLITCAFTMVCLDPKTKMPTRVPPLLVETDKERELFKKGEQNYNAKKALRSHNLQASMPNSEESKLFHEMWSRQFGYQDPKVAQRQPKNVVQMKSTILRTAQIMQPQYRNRHNFMIFGGYLLKQTFELAFCCAASFSRTRPTFLSLDPSTFDNPVPVGSVLYLKAAVVYTDPPFTAPSSSASSSDTSEGEQTGERRFTKVQIRVDTGVKDVEHGPKKATGVFNYTFLVERDIQVMPQTYGDLMYWIDARRRAQDTNASLSSFVRELDSYKGIHDGITG